MLTTANVQDMLDIINRQAFSHNSPGSAAITTAVQACHLLHSNRVQAEEFQRRAMTAIWNCRSPYGDPDFMATLQRIIAVMLVVIFQVCDKTSRSGFLANAHSADIQAPWSLLLVGAIHMFC